MATHEIGDKVYYTGDRANRARWLTVQSVSPDGAVLSGSVVLRDADAPDYVVGVPPAMIGDTYRGHHDPRYVTWDAYNAYHRERYRAHLRDALPESEKASRVRCSECGRVFDLTNENDANEWSFGHDCE